MGERLIDTLIYDLSTESNNMPFPESVFVSAGLIQINIKEENITLWHVNSKHFYI